MATAGQRGPRNILEDTRASSDTAATAAIASISDQDWYISRTHGVYHIPACAKGEPYALVLITSRGDALDLGDNRRFPFTISAREIAEDLLQDLHDHGVFVCAGARPSPEELATSSSRRDTYYHRLVSEGDTMWARGAFGHAGRDVGPLPLDAEGDRGAAVQIRYFAERMPACPHRIAFGNQPVIVGVAARTGGSELFGRWARTRAYKHSMIVQILQKVFGNLAR
jgi:hypothetical protein